MTNYLVPATHIFTIASISNNESIISLPRRIMFGYVYVYRRKQVNSIPLANKKPNLLIGNK